MLPNIMVFKYFKIIDRYLTLFISLDKRSYKMYNSINIFK